MLTLLSNKHRTTTPLASPLSVPVCGLRKELVLSPSLHSYPPPEEQPCLRNKNISHVIYTVERKKYTTWLSQSYEQTHPVGFHVSTFSQPKRQSPVPSLAPWSSPPYLPHSAQRRQQEAPPQLAVWGTGSPSFPVYKMDTITPTYRLFGGINEIMCLKYLGSVWHTQMLVAISYYF